MHAYLRELSNEFGESTNGIRLELNRMMEAGLLEAKKGNTNTIVYSAKKEHPLYNDIRRMVSKYMGINDLLEIVLQSIGDLKKAYLVGDYARGVDGGEIEMVLIGNIKLHYLEALIVKLKEETNRKVSYNIYADESEMDFLKYEHRMLIYSI